MTRYSYSFRTMAAVPKEECMGTSGKRTRVKTSTNGVRNRAVRVAWARPGPMHPTRHSDCTSDGCMKVESRLRSLPIGLTSLRTPERCHIRWGTSSISWRLVLTWQPHSIRSNIKDKRLIQCEAQALFRRLKIRNPLQSELYSGNTSYTARFVKEIGSWLRWTLGRMISGNSTI